MSDSKITQLHVVTIKDVKWVDGLPRIERTIGGKPRIIEGDDVDLLIKEANEFFKNIIISENK